MKKSILTVLAVSTIIAGNFLSLQAQAEYPTSVNSQITDSVTQANVKVLGDAPARALGNLYQTTSHDLSNAAHNATTAQQQSNITNQATTTMGVTRLYSLDTETEGKATKEILSH